MKTKGRKLIALLAVLAMFVTYSFSASVISVYAEDEQGDANPTVKAASTESAAPAAPKAEAEEEQPAPAAPAEEPAAESTDGEDVVAADSEEVEADVIAAEEEAAPAKEEVAEETKDDVPVNIDTDHGIVGPLTYNTVTTLRPTYNNQGSSVIHTWSLSGADGCYTWDESAHQLKNANKSDEMQTVVVIHTQFIKGLMGSTKTEKWTIQLRRASRVVVDYYDWRGSICHTETVINGESTTVWGIPEREGFLFLGWSRTNPAPEVTPADPTFNPGNTIIPSQYATGYQNGVGHLRLYSIWHRSDLNLGTVTGKTDTVPYTGNEQTLYGIVEGSVEGNYTKFYSVKHGNGARVWYTNYYILTNDVYAKGTEPGPYDTAVEFARVYVWNTNDIGGSIAASNMYVKVKKGTLTIEDVPVLTAEAISGSWTYDGTAHPGGPASITLNGEDVTKTWEREGITIGYAYQLPSGGYSRIATDGWPESWSQTNVGVQNYKMIVGYPGAEAVTVYGTLEVTPAKATVTVGVDQIKVQYDGKKHNYIIGIDGNVNFLDADKLITELCPLKEMAYASKIPQITDKVDVDVYPLEISTDPKDYFFGPDKETNDLVHNNFTITIVVKQEGFLEITKAPLTIKVTDQSFTYNGEPQGEEGGDYRNSDVKNKVEFADGTKLADCDSLIQINLNSGMAVDAGTYEDILTANEEGVWTIGHGVDTDAAQKVSLFNFYDVTFLPGTLTIDKADITVTSGSKSKVYDGKPLTCDDYTVEGELAEGDTLEVEFSGSQTEVGSSPNEFTFTITKEAAVVDEPASPESKLAKAAKAKETVDAADNYNITPVYGTLTVKAAGSGNDNDSDKDGSSSETKTGDSTNLFGLLAAMAAAICGLIALFTFRRREE